MKPLNLLAIRTDGGTQARAELNQEVVAEYAEHIREGDKFPPVVVFHDGSEYWLADGFHRYFAHQRAGMASIDADVIAGTQDDAILYSFGANKARGLSMNPTDIRGIVVRMLNHPEWSKWTQAAIAKHIGVSKMTVSRINKSLQTQPEEKEPKKYINKHGQEATIKTQNLGAKKSEPEQQEEPEALEEPKEVALSMPVSEAQEMSDLIKELSDENNRLKDLIAIGQWDASEFEKIDIEETVTQLREQVRILEIDNAALRESRDMFQARNAELMKTVKALQNKIKRMEEK